MNNTFLFVMQRNISGIYFRTQIDGKWTNACFEELTSEEQDVIIDNYTDAQKKRLIKLLADTIKNIGENLDIVR